MKINVGEKRYNKKDKSEKETSKLLSGTVGKRT